MAEEVTCPRCGAPVPVHAPSVYACAFCGATVRTGATAATAIAPAADASEAFRAAFEAARAAGGEFRPALEHAVGKALGPSTNARAFANAMNGMCARFRQESGIEIRGDAMALARVFAAWSKVKAGATDANLPFLAAGESGPAHLAMTFDAATIDHLERGG